MQRDCRRFFLDIKFENNNISNIFSIGLLCEDGTNYYGINLEADFSKDFDRSWVEPVKGQSMENISSNKIKYLKSLDLKDFLDTDAYYCGVRTKFMIFEDVMSFIRPDLYQPIIWVNGFGGKYLALPELFGRSEMPQGMPSYARELQVVIDDLGVREEKIAIHGLEKTNHAFYDAASTMKIFYWLKSAYSHPSLNFGD